MIDGLNICAGIVGFQGPGLDISLHLIGGKDLCFDCSGIIREDADAVGPSFIDKDISDRTIEVNMDLQLLAKGHILRKGDRVNATINTIVHRTVE